MPGRRSAPKRSLNFFSWTCSPGPDGGPDKLPWLVSAKIGGQAAWYPPTTSTPPRHRPSPVSSGMTNHKAYIGSIGNSYQVSGRPAGSWAPGGLARGSKKKVGDRGVCARIVALAETSLPVCLLSRTEQEKLGKEHRSSVFPSVVVCLGTVTCAPPPARTDTIIVHM